MNFSAIFILTVTVMKLVSDLSILFQAGFEVRRYLYVFLSQPVFQSLLLCQDQAMLLDKRLQACFIAAVKRPPQLNFH